ncbi:MAG: TetR/AcrR family transcriptional regulator [Mesorhizobium sp.]
MLQNDSVKTMRPRYAGKNKDKERKEIIVAAAALFFSDGYESTSIERIAESIGCTKGRIYHYYDSKADILFDVHREVMELNINQMAEAVEGISDAMERFRAMLYAHIRLIMNHLPMQAVWAQGVERHVRGRTTPEQREMLTRLIGLRDTYENLFVAAIENGMESGQLRKANPRHVAKVVLGGLNWMTLWYRPREKETTDERLKLADSMIAVILEGARTR